MSCQDITQKKAFNNMLICIFSNPNPDPYSITTAWKVIKLLPGVDQWANFAQHKSEGEISLNYSCEGGPTTAPSLPSTDLHMHNGRIQRYSLSLPDVSYM